MRILIVDDAAFMRMMVKNMATAIGHEVVGEAGDGIEAVEGYKLLKPDIVTMDITMPNLDGIGALKQIIEFDKSAKVVMCSAMGQKAMVIEAIQSGAKDFIIKPFKEEKIREVLSKLESK